MILETVKLLVLVLLEFQPPTWTITV
jgi:hypothetical protein